VKWTRADSFFYRIDMEWELIGAADPGALLNDWLADPAGGMYELRASSSRGAPQKGTFHGGIHPAPAGH
jgi:hypothetical protein